MRTRVQKYKLKTLDEKKEVALTLEEYEYFIMHPLQQEVVIAAEILIDYLYKKHTKLSPDKIKEQVNEAGNQLVKKIREFEKAELEYQKLLKEEDKIRSSLSEQVKESQAVLNSLGSIPEMPEIDFNDPEQKAAALWTIHKNIGGISDISKYFGIPERTVRNWFSVTKSTCKGPIVKLMFENLVYKGIIPIQEIHLKDMTKSGAPAFENKEWFEIV